jgi:hypothetical protein
MNRTKRHILSAILAITLLLLPSTVFAKELGLLTISGPGIKGEVTVDDASVLSKLEHSGFFDQSNRLKQAPENLGEGYTITSQLNLDGKMTPFIEMVYYPVEAGQPGYIHVTGRLDGTTLRKVDEWSKLPAEADKFFRIVMAAKDVTLQSAIAAAPAVVVEAAPQAQPEVQPASAPVASPAPIQLPYATLAFVAVILAGFGAARLLRRRAVSQRSA